MKTTGDPGTGQGLLGPIDATEVHQTGHFILGEGELLAAPVSKGDVSYKQRYVSGMKAINSSHGKPRGWRKVSTEYKKNYKENLLQMS